MEKSLLALANASKDEDEKEFYKARAEGAFGSGFFQMWQNEVGDGSLRGAFYFATMSVLTILFVSLTDD